jgi:predicted RNase H-like HicB family nuclease
MGAGMGLGSREGGTQTEAVLLRNLNIKLKLFCAEEHTMTYGIIFEKIQEPDFEGEYYAHIPSLDLTTQGEGIEGARAAAHDLVLLWLQAKRAHGEPVPQTDDVIFSTIEITEDALQAT